MRRPLQLVLRFVVVTALGVVSIGLIASQMIPQLAKVPDAVTFTAQADISLPTLPEGSVIVDEAGNQVGVLQGSENRVVVPLAEMSEEFRTAVLAVEDADFYEHDGVSARSVLRAIRANSESGDVQQGGSTITQQLVKLSLVGNERSIERKIKEASLAIQLEDQLCGEDATKKQCKDIILQQYLNQIYFGNGAYGAEAAARTYFNKSAKELDLADSAMLAAIIRNPITYNPVENPEIAQQRREVALARMQDEGLITAEGAKFIDALPLPTELSGRSAAVDSRSLTYIERKVRDELLEAEWLAPTEEQRRYLIFNGGLLITTTIDQRAQGLAEAAVADNPIAEANPTAVVGLAAVEPSTGAVRAIVGEVEVDGKVIEIGDPVQGVRSGDGGYSSGSAYKPITMVAALEQGYSITDTIRGDPLPRWAKEDLQLDDPGDSYPDSSSCPTRGSQPLSEHLKQSNNCAFVRLQHSVGYDAVRSTGIELGLTPGPLDPDGVRPACFTIGCDALVTPLGMAQAFATIDNDGRRNPAHFVSAVQDRDGNEIFAWVPPNEQVIRVETARQATEAMTGVTRGTCSRCAISGRTIAGKTGTTEVANGANVSLWFVGFTPELSTAVWIGDPIDQKTGMRGYYTQGGRGPGPIWQTFMSSYLEGAPVVEFPEPESVGRGRSIPDEWSKASDPSKSRSSSSSSRNGDFDDD